VAERRDLFAQQFGVATTDDNRELVGSARRVVLAVKPQQFNEVAASVADLVRPEQLFISIMAGVSTARIEAALRGGSTTAVRAVRVMPNLPVRVGAGIAGICAGAHASPEAVSEVQAILDTGGSSVVLDDEGLMDAVTAVSGSGPAYFYYFVENIVAGGVACGLSEADALKLAQYTCLGAAKMMLESGEPPAELRRKVTSKGGTTQAALEHMEKMGVGAAIRDAVKAAFDRGRELGS
jgi:pyrroline-5-carboxylate reductase